MAPEMIVNSTSQGLFVCSDKKGFGPKNLEGIKDVDFLYSRPYTLVGGGPDEANLNFYVGDVWCRKPESNRAKRVEAQHKRSLAESAAIYKRLVAGLKRGLRLYPGHCPGEKKILWYNYKLRIGGQLQTVMLNMTGEIDGVKAGASGYTTVGTPSRQTIFGPLKTEPLSRQINQHEARKTKKEEELHKKSD